MSNAVAVRTDTALSIGAEQVAWTDTQQAALRHIGVENASPGDLDVFFHVCKRTGLDPFARQIHMICRMESKKDPETDQWVKVPKQTIQTGIDGFRLIGRRAADAAGHTASVSAPLWAHIEQGWQEIWAPTWGPPVAAKVTVTRNGEHFTAVALYAEYVQTKRNGDPTSMWANRPAGQLAKCFSSDTEILTDRGFVPFPQVQPGDRIAQVSPDGLELVAAPPFRQDYDGPMVNNDGDMLNFSVTPNHDMVTTAGKVEAGTLLAGATTVAKWRIPLTPPPRLDEQVAVSDDALRLAGYHLADGITQHRQVRIAVSRPRKRAALRRLALHHSVRVKRDAGRVAVTETRTIVTKSDKEVFVYDVSRLAGTGVLPDKTVDVDALLRLSSRQARLIVEAWIEFDGSRNQAGVRRLRTSRRAHVSVIELLAAHAGFTVNVPRKHGSDISDRICYEVTISEPRPHRVVRPYRGAPGVVSGPNVDGSVWCVTVPSGQIIVRRNGFSMVCGNCAEALAWRMAFPQDLAGMHTDDEMGQADNPERVEQAPARSVTAFARTTETSSEPGAPLAPPGSEEPDDHPGITRPQLAKIAAQLRDLEMTDRAEILAHVSDILGRTIASRNELSKEEASHLIEFFDIEIQAAAADVDAGEVVDAEVVEEGTDA